MTSSIEVIPSPWFTKRLKRLRKSYPRARQDVEPLIDQLLAGETPGDQIQETGYIVYKVRLPNRDARRGKSGGYRVIYYLHTETEIILLTIYTKSERVDITAKEIRDLIADLSDDEDTSEAEETEDDE